MSAGGANPTYTVVAPSPAADATQTSQTTVPFAQSTPDPRAPNQNDGDANSTVVTNGSHDSASVAPMDINTASLAADKDAPLDRKRRREKAVKAVVHPPEKPTAGSTGPSKSPKAGPRKKFAVDKSQDVVAAGASTAGGSSSAIQRYLIKSATADKLTLVKKVKVASSAARVKGNAVTSVYSVCITLCYQEYSS